MHALLGLLYQRTVFFTITDQTMTCYAAIFYINGTQQMGWNPKVGLVAVFSGSRIKVKYPKCAEYLAGMFQHILFDSVLLNKSYILVVFFSF